jgi:tellurite resistance protein
MDSPYRLAPNLFGVSFGTAGVAQAWTLAHSTVGAPDWPADVLWIAASAAWLLILVAYLRNVTSQGRLRTELHNTTTAPFTALVPVVAMLLGVELSHYAKAAGETVYTIGLILTVLLGGCCSPSRCWRRR